MPATPTPKPPVPHHLVDANGKAITKFPARSPVGTLLMLRITDPSYKHPNGTVVVAGGYPPVDPTVLGLRIVPRVTA